MRTESSTSAVPPSPETAKLRKAAADFEALVMKELLREVKFGGTGDDASGDASGTMLDFGHEQLARAIAASGGLGLASIAAQGLAKAGNQPDKPSAVVR